MHLQYDDIKAGPRIAFNASRLFSHAGLLQPIRKIKGLCRIMISTDLEVRVKV